MNGGNFDFNNYLTEIAEERYRHKQQNNSDQNDMSQLANDVFILLTAINQDATEVDNGYCQPGTSQSAVEHGVSYAAHFLPHAVTSGRLANHDPQPSDESVHGQSSHKFVESNVGYVEVGELIPDHFSPSPPVSRSGHREVLLSTMRGIDVMLEDPDPPFQPSNVTSIPDLIPTISLIDDDEDEDEFYNCKKHLVPCIPNFESDGLLDELVSTLEACKSELFNVSSISTVHDISVPSTTAAGQSRAPLDAIDGDPLTALCNAMPEVTRSNLVPNDQIEEDDCMVISDDDDDDDDGVEARSLVEMNIPDGRLYDVAPVVWTNPGGPHLRMWNASPIYPTMPLRQIPMMQMQHQQQITIPSLLDGLIPLSSRSAIPFPRDRRLLEPLLQSVTDVGPCLPKHGQIPDGYGGNTSGRVVVPPTKDLKQTSTNHDSPALAKRRSTGGNAIPLGVRKVPPLLPRDIPDEDVVCLDEFDFDCTMATSSTKSSHINDSTNRPSSAGSGAIRHDANHALKRMRGKKRKKGRVAANEPVVKRKKSEHSRRAAQKARMKIPMMKTPCTRLSNELKQIKLLNETFGIDTSVVVSTVSDVLAKKLGGKSFLDGFLAVSTLPRDLEVEVEGVSDVDKYNALFSDLFGYCDQVKFPGHSAISNQFDRIAANLEPLNLSFDLIFSTDQYLMQRKVDLIWYAKRKLMHQKFVDLSDEVRARKREFMEAQGGSVGHQIKLLEIHAKCRLECQDDLIEYEKFPGRPHLLSRYSRLSLNTISFTDFLSMNAQLVIELDPSLLSDHENLASVQPSSLLKLYSLYELQVSMLSTSRPKQRHYGYVFIKDHPLLIRTDPFESSAEYFRRLRGQQSTHDHDDYCESMSSSCASDLSRSHISKRRMNRGVLHSAGIGYSTLRDYAINCGLAKGDPVASHVARIMAELVSTISMSSTPTVDKEERSTKEVAVNVVNTTQHQRNILVKLIDSADERTLDSLSAGERCAKGLFANLNNRRSYSTRDHDVFDLKFAAKMFFQNTFRRHRYQFTSDILGFDPDWAPSFIVRALPVAEVEQGHDPINTGPIGLYMAVYSAVGIKVFAVDRSVWGATLRSLLKFKTKFIEQYPDRSELIETDINLFFDDLSNSKLGLNNSERIDNAKCNIVIHGLKRLIAQLKLKRNEPIILFDRVDDNLSRYVIRDSLINNVNAVINNAIPGADVDKLGLEQGDIKIAYCFASFWNEKYEDTKFARCLALTLGRVIELNKLILSTFDQFIDSIPFADGCFDYNHYLYFHEEPLSIGSTPSAARIIAAANIEKRWCKLSAGRADCSYYFDQFLGEKRLSAFETTNQYCERIKLNLPQSYIASETAVNRVKCGIVAVIEEIASDGSVCIKEKIKVNLNLKDDVTESRGPRRQVDHLPLVRCGDATAHFSIWGRPNIGLANGIYLLCSWIQRIFRIGGSVGCLMAMGREEHGRGLRSRMIEFCDQFYAELLHSWTIDEIVGLKSEWFPYFTEQTFTFGIPNNNSSLFAVERQQQFALVQFRFLGFTAKAWDLSQNLNVVYLRCLIDYLKQVAEFKNNQFETDLCIESIEMLKSCFSDLIVLKSDLMNKLILLHFGGEVVADKVYRFALKSLFVPQFIHRMKCLTAATDFVIKCGRSFDCGDYCSKFL